MTGLPMRIEDVTAEWLTQALSVRHPGTVVRGIDEREVINGSATKLLLTVSYAGGARVPERLCVKGGFDEAQRGIGGGGFLGEVRFFADLASRMPVPLPCSYFEHTEGRSDGQSIVILEDLRSPGVRFGSPTVELDVDMAAATLELMARWHGHFWAGRGLHGIEWLTVGSPALRSIIGHLTSQAHWDKHMALPKADPIPAGPLRDAGAVRTAMHRLWALDDADVHTLLHGDTHIGNMYFEQDRPRFLDWQSPMLGPWSHDVANFLAGALAVEHRRANERELLRLYRQALRAGGGPDVDDDQAWLGYRRHVLHGYLWVLTPEEMQSAENTTAMTRRYSAAADDLDSLDAITKGS